MMKIGQPKAPVTKPTLAESVMWVLHSYLHFEGRYRNYLSSDQHNTAMSYCDGYGHLTIHELESMGLTAEWSHVRDSSADGQCLAAAYILSLLKEHQLSILALDWAIEHRCPADFIGTILAWFPRKETPVNATTITN